MLLKSNLVLVAAALAIAVPISAAPASGNDDHSASYANLACTNNEGGIARRAQPITASGVQSFDAKLVKIHDTPAGEKAKDSPLGNPPLVNTVRSQYVAPGVGKCNVYRDSSMTACIDLGWNFQKGNFPCDLWIEAKYNDKTVQLRVDDACPGAGCSGIYFSKRAIQILGGNAAVNAGSLPAGTVTWKFLKTAPWWACWSGLGGKTLDGKTDTCAPQSKDEYGCPRDGLKHGSDRVIGDKVYTEICPNYSLTPNRASLKAKAN